MFLGWKTRRRRWSTLLTESFEEVVDPVQVPVTEVAVFDAVVDEDVAVAGRQREQAVVAETIKLNYTRVLPHSQLRPYIVPIMYLC